MPPAATCGKRARKLLACLRVGQDAFHALAQKGVAVRFLEFVPDDQETRTGMLVQNIAEQGAGGLMRRMSVDDVDGCLGEVEVAQVRRKHGIELFRRDLKSRVFQQAMQFVEHHGVRREKADLEIRFAVVLGHGAYLN